MSEKDFKQHILGEWVDNRPILIIAGTGLEFDFYMQAVAKDSKGAVRRGSRWEVDGTIYYYITRPEQIRGTQPKDIQFIGSYLDRPNISELQEEAKWRMAGRAASQAKKEGGE